MSKYKKTFNSDTLICPYCRCDLRNPEEFVSESGTEIQCDECGEKFYATAIISTEYYGQPDCALNGKKHQWEPDGIPFEYRGHAYYWRNCLICNRRNSRRDDQEWDDNV